MTKWMLAFSVGVIILHCTGIVLPWNVEVLWRSAIFGVLALLFFPTRLFIIAAFFFCGYFYAAFSVHSVQSSWMPLSQVGKDMTIEGYTCSLPKEKEHFFSVEFCGVSKHAQSETHPVSSKVVRFHLSGAIDELKVFQGSFVRIHAKFKAPRASVNPVGHSYEKLLFSKRIVGRLWLKRVERLELLNDKVSINDRILSYLNTVRWNADAKLRQSLDPIDLEHSGILRALAIGDRSDISSSDNQILQESGLQHLMAISGLHVGMVLGLLSLVLPNSRWTLVLVSLLGFAYILSVGFSESSQRAWVMGVLMLCMYRGAFNISPWKVFNLALIFVLILEPLAPMRLGFWYSFGAIFLVFFSHHFGWLDRSRPFRSLLVLQALFVLFGAIMNAHFALPHSASMWAANLLAIPLVSWLVLPLVILGTLLSIFQEGLSFISHPIFLVANEILHLVLTFSEALLSVDISLKTPNAPLRLLSLATMLCCLLMLKHNRIGVFAILLTFVAYLISPAKTLHSNAPQMVVFDSGQGLSVLFEHLGDVWLYDLGPAFESYSVSERVVMPFLRGHDLKDRVQGLVLSHGDADHVGRAEWFVQKALPRYKISGEPDRVPDGFNDCEPGRVFKVGDANLEILYSANSGITDVRSRGLNSNSRSCVIRFRYKQYNVLLMGDLEGRAEMDFVKLLGEGIESNILILGHHGSANASSYALLKRVNPELAIASAGFDNRFGHPSHKVLARLRNLNIKTLNTATSGALTIRFAEEQIQIVEERKNNPAFWMWPGG